MTIEMHDPKSQIMEKLQSRQVSQASLALTYAFLIAQEGKNADWLVINAAIQQRWRSKTALERVKTMAWQQVEEWRNHERRNSAR